MLLLVLSAFPFLFVHIVTTMWLFGSLFDVQFAKEGKEYSPFSSQLISSWYILFFSIRSQFSFFSLIFVHAAKIRKFLDLANWDFRLLFWVSHQALSLIQYIEFQKIYMLFGLASTRSLMLPHQGLHQFCTKKFALSSMREFRIFHSLVAWLLGVDPLHHINS